jgi:hypothetical protein
LLIIDREPTRCGELLLLVAPVGSSIEKIRRDVFPGFAAFPCLDYSTALRSPDQR